MKKVMIASIWVVIFVCFTSCQKTYLTPNGAKTYQKPIDSIYVYQSGFGQRFPEYKIDLKNKKFWSFTSEVSKNFTPRDSSATDEGFTFTCNLDDDKIETFILETSRHGFINWKTSYENKHILDGLQWGIDICLSDGTQKQISGSNAFPETWKDVCSDFKSLTGAEILPINAPDQYK